ncbi:MAG: Transcription elongation factor GreA [Actinobacteria bacterium ADurb.Bin346]|nr:MAG: Transcription elongation factor GreA [Actinobacteria bacterium ADurb.Bin346]
MKEYRLTQEGLKMLQSELDDLVKNKRKEVAERLRESKEFGGDLTENPEYEHAKNDQAFIEGRIEQISEILQNYIIVENEIKGRIDLGAVVILKDMDDKKEKKFKIVSSIESDPEKNKISDESPVGKALLNKIAGDTITVKTPVTTKTYKIIDIS